MIPRIPMDRVINHAPSNGDTIVHMKNELHDAGGDLGMVKL